MEASNELSRGSLRSGPVTLSWGQCLRLHRERRGLTLEKLSARSGVSAAAISRIERSQRFPTTPTLDRLAGALGLSASKLARPPEGELFQGHLDTLTGGDAEDLAQSVQALLDLRLLAQAVHVSRGLAHAAIVSFVPGRKAEAVEPDRLNEFEEALTQPSDAMHRESIPYARLLHELGKFYMFLGVLAGVGKLKERPEHRFYQAEAMFLESLRIKENCDASLTHILPTLVKLDELVLERVNFGNLRRERGAVMTAKELAGVRRELGDLRARVEARAQQYERVASGDSNRALQGALGNCKFLLARVSYLEARAILHGASGQATRAKVASRSDAEKLFAQACKEASECRKTKEHFQFHDGVFWADALMAKCTMRMLQCGSSGEEASELLATAVARYRWALSTNRSRLWNLRSLCFLESLCRDVSLARDTDTEDVYALREWAVSVDDRLGNYPTLQLPETACCP